MSFRFVSSNRLASLVIVSGAFAFSALSGSSLSVLAPQDAVGDIAPVTVIAAKSTTTTSNKPIVSGAGRKIA